MTAAINYSGIAEVSVVGPNKYTLYQNYPNPFNPSTTIDYYLPKEGKVVLKVYNILSQEVATLVNENQAAGRHSISFDASKLPGGVYLYKIQAGSFSQVKKMILFK